MLRSVSSRLEGTWKFPPLVLIGTQFAISLGETAKATKSSRRPLQFLPLYWRGRELRRFEFLDSLALSNQSPLSGAVPRRDSPPSFAVSRTSRISCFDAVFFGAAFCGPDRPPTVRPVFLSTFGVLPASKFGFQSAFRLAVFRLLFSACCFAACCLFLLPGLFFRSLSTHFLLSFRRFFTCFCLLFACFLRTFCSLLGLFFEFFCSFFACGLVGLVGLISGLLSGLPSVVHLLV